MSRRSSERTSDLRKVSSSYFICLPIILRCTVLHVSTHFYSVSLFRALPSVLVPDGEKVDRLHVTFFLSKFSPLQRGFDGHCGVVYTLDSEMYLDNHPGVPKQLRRLKYFVAGFGSRAVPRDPFSQQSIDIWAFRSRKDAEEKALKLRDKPSAVQRLHPDAEPVRLGVVQPGSKGDEKAYVVDSHVLKPAHVYGECKEVLGKVKRNEFYSRKEAQEFADGLWKFDNPRELPLINPSKNTLLNCVRVKPRKQAEQFFSTLRNVTFLSLGTSLKSKSDRVARIRLDRRFRKSKDAWQYARNHRPGKVVVTQAALPSKLLALSSRRRLSVRECLKDAAPQKIVQALSALLPDDPYRTQVNYEYVKRLKGVWKSHRTHSGLKPWQLEALKLRLHPSAGSFSRTWRLWNKSKKRLDKYDGY